VGAGAYPGSFDPLTVAHLAIAEAAWHQGGLDVVCLVVSRLPLGKDRAVARLDHRVSVLSAAAAGRPWLEVAVTDKQLIADVAADYDAVVMGSDKWAQVCDTTWYGGSVSARDAAVAALPRVLLAGRPGFDAPAPLPTGVVVLEVDAAHGPVSSSAARGGRLEWMAPEAADLDARTGAWSEPERYRSAN
jgi:hypothetical protein